MNKIKIIYTIRMKVLCFFSIHKWVLKREKHKIEGRPDGREYIRIPVRECSYCHKRQYHESKRGSLVFGHKWINLMIEKDQTIQFKQY